ncbi:postacrosomal sheath WW domain-binding protein [Rhynchonycteris naso]
MAVNQNHTENRRGAVIPYGESVLKQCPDVDLSFLQQPVGSNLFSGTKRGMLFLTSYRVIFVTSHSISDPMLSFMMPFDLMSNCTVEQPVFAPNYIKGTIQANPDGGWEGQATFKLAFRRGGAILFFELMMKAASAAAHGVPLGSINDWFGAPGLFIITGQGSMVCSQRMPCADQAACALRSPEPHASVQDAGLWNMKLHHVDMKLCLWDTEPPHQDMESHLQDMESRLYNMDSHLQDMESRLYNMDSHLQDMESRLYNMESHLQDMESRLYNMESHLQDMEPHQLEMNSHLRDMKLHLLEIELNLTILWQPSLLEMRLHFLPPHLLRPIYHLLRSKP